MSSLSREGAGGGQGGKVVALKSNKKPMDREHYLDATQRCVPAFFPSSSFVFPHLTSSLGFPPFFFCIFSGPFLNYECSGIIRAVNASRFGAPDAVAATVATTAAAAAGNEHSSSSSASSLHEESAAGSHLTALHSLLRHRHHHHHHDDRGEVARVDGAGDGGEVGDSGSETASINVSVTVSASPEERRHRRHHLGRLKNLVRRHGD